MSEVVRHSRLIARAAEQLGAGEARVFMEESYQGVCTVYTSNGKKVATLPSVTEACRVARYAIVPEGGYGSVEVHPEPEADVTHEDWQEWAFG